MEEKFTYLLGAGASACVNGLPLAKKPENNPNVLGLADAMRNLKIKLTQDIQTSKISSSVSYFINDLDWLSNESEKFNTVDTLAKYYLLKEEKDNLIRLKRTLST
jgi:hypothetical protein